jgi:cardiolipin synthase
VGVEAGAAVAATCGSERQHAVTRLLRHLPNLLTGLRLVSAPAIGFLILQGLDKPALGVFLFAGLSDAVDGYLAKRLAPGSRFGAYLDPAADKLLMLVCFLALMKVGATPVWLPWIVIGRDIAIVTGIGLALALAVPLRIAPLWIGKVSTAVQIAYIGWVLLTLAFGIDASLSSKTAAYLTAAVTLASWLAYGQVLLKALAPGRRTA